MTIKPNRLYRLYVDESGDHTYGKKTVAFTIKSAGTNIEVPDYVELKDDRKRYLSLTGCVIEAGFYENIFSREMEQLKKSHFPYDVDDPFAFHREDIVNKRKPFYCLKDPEKEAAFNADLLVFVRDMEYRIITVVIDKKAHIEKYGNAAYHPYHYCLTALLERYCGLLRLLGAKGDVLAESRGSKEDEQLKRAYTGLYNGGSNWRPNTHLQNVLTSKEIKLKKKIHNISGLQLADMLAHPLKLHVLTINGRITAKEDFGAVVVNEVIDKFNKNISNGKIDGYGRIFL